MYRNFIPNKEMSIYFLTLSDTNYYNPNTKRTSYDIMINL